MLQRIQTLFLLLAILANLAVLWVPAWQINHEDSPDLITGMAVTHSDADGNEVGVPFYAHQESNKASVHTAYFSLISISVILLLFIVFKYKNRMLQIRLSYFAIALILGEILALILLAFISETEDSIPHFGIVFPVTALILISIAIRRIKADENLVRSVDRIR